MPNIPTVAPGTVAQSVAAADLGVGPAPAATGKVSHDNALSPDERTQAASAMTKYGMQVHPNDVPGTAHGVLDMIHSFFANAGAAAAQLAGIDKLPTPESGEGWIAGFKKTLGIGQDAPTFQAAKQDNGDGSFDISRF